jgi:hypothetical protein
MSIRPDYSLGPITIYEHLGIVKIGPGYVDFSDPDRPEVMINDDFRSLNGIYYFYVDHIIGFVYNDKFYNCTKGKLISTQYIVYEYDTISPAIGIPCYFHDLKKRLFHYVVPIDCVTQINDKFTFMKINHYNVLVEGLFTASDEIFIVKDKDNKNYISVMSVNIQDLQFTLDSKPRKWLVGPDSIITLIPDDYQQHKHIKCPFDQNHDPECCEIVKFNIPDNVTYVAICSGKIRIVDGKPAGQYTKAALRF